MSHAHREDTGAARAPQASLSIPVAGFASTVPATALLSRARYLQLLAWTFTLFNSVRVLAYLPTMASILASGNSDQHSLLTWLTWMGANATMAVWLWEHNGQRLNRAVLVNIGNCTMCLLTVLLIAVLRF